LDPIMEHMAEVVVEVLLTESLADLVVETLVMV
jgi:hypothetical protein